MKGQHSKYNASKKGIEDIPTSFLIELLLGLFAIIAIGIPLFEMFVTQDYNRDVAQDTMHSFKNYVDYMRNNYELSNSLCVEPFNTQYLSTPQVLIEDKNNYVITIFNDKMGLMYFNDFLILKDEDQQLDDDFDTFHDIEFEEELPSFHLMELGINTIDLDNSQEIQVMFLVPTIAIENSLVSGVLGNTVNGYYVFYGIFEDGSLKIEPDSSWFKKLIGGGEASSDIDLYDIGFFRDGGSRFGVLKNNNARYNVVGNCDKPFINLGDQSSFNTRGFACTARYDKISEDGESVSSQLVRNNLYWEGGESSYVCNSEYRGDKKFCDDMAEIPHFHEVLSNNEKLNDEQTENTKKNFTQFCNNFYASIDGLENLSIENTQSDEVVADTEFKFEDYFEKVEVEEIIEIEAQSEEKIKLYEREDELDEDRCQFNQKEINKIESTQISKQDICSSIMTYTRDDNGARTDYIYYIPLQDRQKSGFYMIKDNSEFNTRKLDSGEFEISIGNRILESLSSEPDELGCSWFKWFSGFFWFSNGCEKAEFLQVQINDNFFTDVGNRPFNIFLPPELIDTTNALDTTSSFSTYFTKVDENNRAGKNNEAVTIDGEEYILNTMHLDTRFKNFERNTVYTVNTILGDNLNDETKIQFQIDTPSNSNQLSFDIYKNYYENNNDDNKLEFHFDSQSESLQYSPSYEQLLLSMYDSQSLSIGDIKRQIENKNIKLDIFEDDSSLGKYYGFVFYFRTKENIKPIFQTYQQDGQPSNKIYSPSLHNEKDQLKKLYENDAGESVIINNTFIFPEKKSNGDIILKEIPYELTEEEFISIARESGYDAKEENMNGGVILLNTD